MQLKDAIAQAVQLFNSSGIPSPIVDAEVLAAWVLNIDRKQINVLAISDAEFSADQLDRYRDLTARRAKREPLQHLTGTAHFRNLELNVGPGVFIPRPETEQLVERAIHSIGKVKNPLIVDLCSGSGAVAISLAKEIPDSIVYAVEISPDAFEYLSRNFQNHQLGGDLLRLGDVKTALTELNGQLDMVVANPPYIPEGAVPIYEEVRLFDPALALYSGTDGLDLIREISVRGLELLKPGGALLMEHSDTQAESVREILLADGWVEIQCHQDLTGRDRITEAKKSN